MVVGEKKSFLKPLVAAGEGLGHKRIFVLIVLAPEGEGRHLLIEIAELKGDRRIHV